MRPTLGENPAIIADTVSTESLQQIFLLNQPSLQQTSSLLNQPHLQQISSLVNRPPLQQTPSLQKSQMPTRVRLLVVMGKYCSALWLIQVRKYNKAIKQTPAIIFSLPSFPPRQRKGTNIQIHV